MKKHIVVVAALIALVFNSVSFAAPGAVTNARPALASSDPIREFEPPPDDCNGASGSVQNGDISVGISGPSGDSSSQAKVNISPCPASSNDDHSTANINDKTGTSSTTVNVGSVDPGDTVNISGTTTVNVTGTGGTVNINSTSATVSVKNNSGENNMTVNPPNGAAPVTVPPGGTYNYPT